MRVLLWGGPHDGTVLEVPQKTDRVRQYTLHNRPCSTRIALMSTATENVDESIYEPYVDGGLIFRFRSSKKLLLTDPPL